MDFCVLLACTFGCVAGNCHIEEDVPLLQHIPSLESTALSAEAVSNPANFAAEGSDMLLQEGDFSGLRTLPSNLEQLEKTAQAAISGSITTFEMTSMPMISSQVKAIGEIPLTDVAGFFGINAAIDAINSALPGVGYFMGEVVSDQTVYGLASGMAVGAADIAGYVMGGPVAGDMAANALLGAEVGGKMLWKMDAVKALAHKQMVEVAKVGAALSAASEAFANIDSVKRAREAAENVSNAFTHRKDMTKVKTTWENYTQWMHPQGGWKNRTEAWKNRTQAAIQNATDKFNNLDVVQDARFKMKLVSDSILQMPEVNKVEHAKVKDIVLSVRGLQGSIGNLSEALQERPEIQAARFQLNHAEEVLTNFRHTIVTKEVVQKTLETLGISAEDLEDASQGDALENKSTNEVRSDDDGRLGTSAENSEDAASQSAAQKKESTRKAVQNDTVPTMMLNAK